jgi:UDP-N-acetylmuramoylalanine--D-glutamate ligase
VAEEVDLCVASPAFAPEHPWLQRCRERGIPVIAEMELGYAYWPGKILAITGSKGKSSLVKLCADTLQAAGLPAAPAGNYGTPLSALVLDQPRLAWAVTEVSSFQLELTEHFRPRVALLLNLQADHLDRHGDLEHYRRLKLRLFARQGAGDTALLPDDFELAGDELPAAVGLQRFGTRADAAWRYTPGRVCGGGGEVSLRGSWFDNNVLGLAAAAAAGALRACGLDAAPIAAGFAAFTPLPHRMERVGLLRGVRFVDDSKATSLAATAAGIRMSGGEVRLIAGGRLKESELDAIKELLTAKVKKVYLIGESACRLEAAWSSAVSCERCGDLEHATRQAAREAQAGETVLLSPGCASFDQFGSYKQRGECFARIVKEMAAAPAEAG